MIFVIYLEDMSSTHQGQFYESMEHFGRSKFDVQLSENGVFTIDGKQAPTSYRFDENDKNCFTREEAFIQFFRSPFFKSFAKSRFYTAYKTEKLI